MSKNVAIISASREVVAINVHNDDYTLAPYEVLVTGPAYVGGDYVDGYFYPPQPFPSWTRLEGEWIPPVAHPGDGLYSWNEDMQEWVRDGE